MPHVLFGLEWRRFRLCLRDCAYSIRSLLRFLGFRELQDVPVSSWIWDRLGALYYVGMSFIKHFVKCFHIVLLQVLWHFYYNIVYCIIIKVLCLFISKVIILLKESQVERHLDRNLIFTLILCVTFYLRQWSWKVRVHLPDDHVPPQALLWGWRLLS